MLKLGIILICSEKLTYNANTDATGGTTAFGRLEPQFCCVYGMVSIDTFMSIRFEVQMHFRLFRMEVASFIN